MRFHAILRHSFADGVHEAKPMLRGWLLSLGGLTKPASCLSIVFWQPFAGIVRKLQVERLVRISLVGGFAYPVSRFDVVLRHALPQVVHTTKAKLGFRQAQLGGFAKPSSPFGIVLIDSFALVVRKTQIVWCGHLSALRSFSIP